MGNILEINKIAENREKAKELTSRVIKRGDKENLRFGDILQEEIEKMKRGENSDSSKKI
ncbi:hypothetical protein [Clostridium weizhouense]|uniref:Uncharacterized protein n=1 Tax=Clostridium weizhouense TaxID=2859781 RepID=A0ABS7AK61_9CLOT|nr:hypothetical protein [Clostridium weizhouense]MBW6409023.1 hypothetical protein [Clostridium weizhouense]